MIPESIKKLAQKVRTEIYGRDVRESIAQSMEVSGETSNEANERSKDTATRQTDVENRFDDQIAGNTDIDEVIDARRPEGGESYPTLRKRLDDEHKEVTTQLAHIHINVKARGVVGNGVSDDTQTILDIIEEVENSDNRTPVYFPKGVYRITDSIVLEKLNLKIYGAGIQSTVLLFDLPDNTKAIQTKYPVDLHDLSIDSGVTSTQDTVGKETIGLYMDDGFDWGTISPHNLSIRGFSYGVVAKGTIRPLKESVLLNNDVGYKIEGRPQTFSTLMQFENVWFGYNNRGLVAEREENLHNDVVVGLSIKNCVFESNYKRGIDFNGSFPGLITIEENWFEKNGEYDYYFNGSHRPVFKNNRFEDGENGFQDWRYTTGRSGRTVINDDQINTKVFALYGNGDLTSGKLVNNLELENTSITPQNSKRIRNIKVKDVEENIESYLMKTPEQRHASVFVLQIDRHGEITRNNLPDDVTVSVEKPDTGEYVVTFNRQMQSVPLISVRGAFPFGNAGNVVRGYYHTIDFRNNYNVNNYPTFSEIIVQGYMRDPNGEDVKNDIYIDIMLHGW